MQRPGLCTTVTNDHTRLLRSIHAHLFLTFDANADGFIDFVEFRSLLAAQGLDCGEDKARLSFDALDVDQSGELDFSEFRVAMYTLEFERACVQALT